MILPKQFLALSLLAVGLCLLSCNDQAVQLEKKKVQFVLTPGTLPDGRVDNITLPENARAIISVTSSSGTSVLSDHEVAVSKVGESYVTDMLELMPGAYRVTDFMIVNEDEDFYVTPKSGAELSSLVADALPYNFSTSDNTLASVHMPVVDVRNQDLRKAGYASSKSKGNTSLSITVYETKAGQTYLTSATASVSQNNKLIKRFSLAADVNNVTLGGDHKAPYTLIVYTGESAKTQTFDIKQLKQELGKNALKVTLEPALFLTIQSGVDPANENEDYFSYRMDGAGAVNINWGDGSEVAGTLPFAVDHEYFAGDYTAIITGDIHQITDFYGFAYSTNILAIGGVTNLTSLKRYDPSWGAVPIKVDLSNCKQLEAINVAKLGAPYEPCDLRTEFKLPTEHFINSFIFDAPSFSSDREFISAEDLDVMVSNIYNNTVNRQIFGGQFFINPVVTPAPETQQKLDILESEYNWDVRTNDEIYEGYYSEAGRSRTNTADASREKWLRNRFSDSAKIIQRAKVAFAD
jgi:hypothetical protein